MEKTNMKILIACLAAAILWPTSSAHAIGTITPVTPQERAALHREDLLTQAGEDALLSDNYVGAEKNFRAVLKLDRWDSQAYQGIAESLLGQHRPAEAVPVYKALIYRDPLKWSSTASETRALMGYAIALCQAGNWTEAVAIYEKALPDAQYGDAPKLDIHFDPDTPMPDQLQVIAHVAIGLQYFGGGEDKEALMEFGKGLRLDPDSVFANYYYGYGWGAMSPGDKAKFGSEQQAKAALQKAVKLGKGPVKSAAQKALQVASRAK
jgi:tetratricopeptide (TPR) repeat protein